MMVFYLAKWIFVEIIILANLFAIKSNFIESSLATLKPLMQ